MPERAPAAARPAGSRRTTPRRPAPPPRDQHEHHGLEREVDAVQHAEGRAGVVDAGQAQPAGARRRCCRAARAGRGPAPWSTGRATTTVDRDDELEAAHRRGLRGSPASASASTQRGHRPSRPAALVTSGTTRQQRSHLVPSARVDRRPAAASSAPSPAVEPHAPTRRRASAGTPRSGAAGRARRRPPARSTAADRLPPMVLSCRFCSSATFTDVAHGAERGPALDERRRRAGPRGPRGKSAMCTDASRAPGQAAPQLVHRHRQDRRQQPRQAVDDREHRRLARAPRLASAAPKVYIRSLVTST